MDVVILGRRCPWLRYYAIMMTYELSWCSVLLHHALEQYAPPQCMSPKQRFNPAPMSHPERLCEVYCCAFMLIRINVSASGFCCRFGASGRGRCRLSRCCQRGVTVSQTCRQRSVNATTLWTMRWGHNIARLHHFECSRKIVMLVVLWASFSSSFWALSSRISGCTQKYGPLSTPVTASHQGGVTGARTFCPFVELFEIQRDKGYNHDDKFGSISEARWTQKWRDLREN